MAVPLKLQSVISKTSDKGEDKRAPGGLQSVFCIRHLCPQQFNAPSINAPDCKVLRFPSSSHTRTRALGPTYSSVLGFKLPEEGSFPLFIYHDILDKPYRANGVSPLCTLWTF
ncbi:hypothetical protein CDAR_599541 [Caerostris darwini]|uniref:Uncharacterized protein n=1 Tax=Caerostris darwini TaxID=1538125 RepID=A0AAV4P040_9ARAC|nr:hypothetical protein CDAR_599541 [Caerostris darwini]